MNEPVSLSEKLYLLGIHPEKGGVISAAHTAMDYLVLGSLFLELYLAHNIHFEGNRLILLNSKSENKIHAFLLEKISGTDRNLKIRRWISKFYFSRKYIRGYVQQKLVEKRLIKLTDRHFLFFSWERPVLLNRQFAYHLVEDINNIVFKGSTSDEDLLLILLIQPGGLMRRIFNSRERRIEAKKRIKDIESKNLSSGVISNAMQVVKAINSSVAAANMAHHGVV